MMQRLLPYTWVALDFVLAPAAPPYPDLEGGHIFVGLAMILLSLDGMTPSTAE